MRSDAYKYLNEDQTVAMRNERHVSLTPLEPIRDKVQRMKNLVREYAEEKIKLGEGPLSIALRFCNHPELG